MNNIDYNKIPDEWEFRNGPHIFISTVLFCLFISLLPFLGVYRNLFLLDFEEIGFGIVFSAILFNSLAIYIGFRFASSYFGYNTNVVYHKSFIKYSEIPINEVEEISTAFDIQEFIADDFIDVFNFVLRKKYYRIYGNGKKIVLHLHRREAKYFVWALSKKLNINITNLNVST